MNRTIRNAAAPGGDRAGGPPRFSIVIPAYNRADTIGRAIESCLAQTCPDFEVIVVDDGSRDNTAAAVEAMGDPRIRCIRQPNAGASAARNTGAGAAAGEFLAFLDSDDEFLPHKLQRLEAAIRAADAPELTVWYSPLLFDRGDGNRMVKPPRAIGPDESVGDYLFADEGLMQTSTLVIPRALFARVSFDRGLRCLEDLDLCLRLEEAGARFRMLPEPEVIWHDDRAAGRLSYTTSQVEVLEWAARQAGRLSPRAMHGYLARFLVPQIVRTRPLRAVSLLAAAIRHGGLGPSRAAMLLARGAAPGIYGRLRDAVTKVRHA
ncbi:glycosyltransferase family 2 protein [Paracoccus sp. (in: a-proteobacteria)]|uniref:glycosyltransferase family 2 protein n=1 Tax=Paracoccus sp. TaxID=267 RepID=UPI0026E09697|nr:glycosyltransferase family 2 protein [Paracoccus sp. (in: a-proteobacteria)]MDO5369600.1 glycosyltransferase family 2 protein [Paracoccus sp. (in: a-proteobacteria)]